MKITIKEPQKSYGLGGVLGLLEDLAPGFAVVISPVEIRDMMGTQLIDTGTNGTHLGWEWNVIGPDEVDGEEMWKVSMENLRNSRQLFRPCSHHNVGRGELAVGSKAECRCLHLWR